MKKNNYLKKAGGFLIALSLLWSVKADPGDPRIDADIVRDPVTGKISLKVEAPAADTFTVKIYDSTKAEVKSIAVYAGTIALPQLPQGSYTFVVLDAKGNIVDKGDFKLPIPVILPPVPKPDTSVHHPPVPPDTAAHHPPVPPDTAAHHPPVPPVHPPVHIHAHVEGHHRGDTLKLRVEADSMMSFDMTIYNDTGAVVKTLTVSTGMNTLPSLMAGRYSFILKDAKDSIVARGRFSIEEEHPRPVPDTTVHPPVPPVHPHMHIHARVEGHRYDDTLKLIVDADTTLSLTLTIYNDTGAVVKTLTVTNGVNVLPALAVGRYSFTLKDNAGNIVERGPFSIEGPHVHTGVFPNPGNVGEASINVEAPASETFTLKIYDNTGLPVISETIQGGVTKLPATLNEGIYNYILLDVHGNVVARGRIMIHK